ncbi:Apolipoprotein N-acyltransferase [Posidoniimonas corsicana]|uniref:Apolipoprotein N-acyltransferase n=2 Tax=Posidoniimonas corsicana TaxID=1938618 RepID=A0A5C5VJW6_9BACT|nr:Apolipoprotein N-acyltransferase [Posidoniimonas corsicana]
MPPAVDTLTPAPSSDDARRLSLGARLLRSPFATMLLGSLLLWLAQPGTARLIGLPWAPLGLAGWFAVTPWVWLAMRDAPLRRMGWVQVWLGGWAYWLLTLYWICLPHPLTPIGWPLLAGYLAVYPLAFVALTRRAIRAAPVWVAAPLVYAGLEWVQAHLFTGFLMGALSHTQAGSPIVMQISDLTGAYGVSFVLTLTASCLAPLLQRDANRGRRFAAATTAAATVVAVLYYGQVRLLEASNPAAGPVVGLIQGATLATWDPDPSRNQTILDAQLRLTRQAAEEAAEIGLRPDLYIWPESMFRAPVVTLGNQVKPTDQLPEALRRFGIGADQWFSGLSAEQGAAFLLGADRFDMVASEDEESGFAQTGYNTAVLVDADGQLLSFYDKTHRVPFGEYIPFAKNMPALYFLTPMSGGLGEGEGPVAMPIQTAGGEFLLAPNICYETVIPHVIRRQVATLSEQGQRPDVLVNITNDAWFWGATELDLHLAVGQFRAVENRTPMVIAANTGLSAVIDGAGRVRRVSERMVEDVIVDSVPLDPRESFYSRHGDWFALGCLLGTVVLLLAALRPRSNDAPPADA